MARLDYILQLMAKEEADGIRLKAGSTPEIVIGRTSKSLPIPPFKEGQLRDFVREITTTEDLAQLHAEGQVQLHYEYQGRFFACDIALEQGKLRAEFKALGAEDGTEPPESAITVDPAAETNEADLSQFEFEPAPPTTPLEVRLMELDDETAPAAFGRDEGPPPPRAPSMAMPPTKPGARKPGGIRPKATIEYTRSEATTPPDYGRHLNRDEFDKLLRWMVEQDATDLHITPRFPPTLRVDNLFQPSKGRVFAPEEIEKVIHSILGERERRIFEENMAVDLSYQVEGIGRFRINVFRQLYGTSAAVRHVRSAIESLDQLNLPAELTWLSGQEAGLVLFTGPTGSGKSTTMAAIIEQMNLNRQLHILTLEAPIEFLFTNAKCLIQQREVGVHTPDFPTGLRDALRENPDVIMVGELRDLETVAMSVNAGETGHLILATMHANTTVNAVSRLIDVFPDNQKAGARAMISDVLKAVVNLRLLRHKSGRGLVPAVEFLKNNNAVSALIRENKLHQVRQVITTASAEGMWPFERHLVELQLRGEVDYDAAFSAAPDKKVFDQYMSSKTDKDTKKKRGRR
jgi:twitching motility protein PilT